ncbi:MFS transporter [Tetragenococcus koreensis]|uniref:MFS transporter n=1 Tax=Tetragenococcus koreensis TaxID=290335 RepID=UPI001F47EFE8|nr:MFS transporter [Tetragenococcus koreensis]MCF1620381.1 MFS transporter [Tetragenococcus koreensis]MCF1657862.1 MFS transporter [Tetragenococcus koreensis]
MQKFKVQSFILILVSFLLGFSEFIIVGILDDVAASFAVDVSTAGYLVTIFALAYAISTPIVTTFIGQRRLLNVLLLLMGIFTVGNLVTALAPTYTILTISRVVVAIVSGSGISVIMAFGTYLAPLEKRAWLVAWIFSGFSIASVFGVPLGTLLSTQFGWRSAFYLITGLSFILLFFIKISLPGDLRQSTSDSNRISDQLAIFKDRRIQLSVFLTMFSLAGIYVVYTYLRPIFSTELNIAPSLITLAFTAYGFMSLLSNQLSGKIAEKRGLLTMPKVYIAEIFILGFLPLLLNIRWLGFLDLMLLGLTMYLINSPIQLHILGIAEKEFPQSMVLASSFNSIFSNIGIAIGSALGGQIGQNFGMQALGPGGAVLAAITLVLTLMLNRKNAKVSAERAEV